MSLIRVFQIVLRDGGNKILHSGGGMGNFTRSGFFLSAGGHFRWSAFDYSLLFQIKKHHSVNIEHQLKSKLARPVNSTKCMKLKQKWCSSNGCS